MTTVTLNGRTFGMIDVPEGAHSFKIIDDDSLYFKAYFVDIPNVETIKQIPKGKWKLHGLASALSETDWQGIVEQHIVGDEQTGEAWKWYKDYLGGLSAYEFADESGMSLLASQGKEAGKVVIVELLK